MKFNDAGLPEPGRELDAWIWMNVFGGGLAVSPDGTIVAFTELEPHLHHDPQKHQYSTTAAYHQVMEAMRGEWSFEITLTNLYAWVTVRYAGTGEILAIESITPSKLMLVEEMAAHAVCACVWKAKGGER